MSGVGGWIVCLMVVRGVCEGDSEGYEWIGEYISIWNV